MCNTDKETLTGLYHFAKMCVWNKETNQIEQRLLIIRKTRTRTGEEIKYSFTNTEMGQFQTRKLLAWQHQVAMNMITMGFMLKVKLYCFAKIPSLSATDIKDWLCFFCPESKKRKQCFK